MSNANNNNVMPHGEKAKPSEMQEFKSIAVNEAGCNSMHPDYSVPNTAPPMHMYPGGSHNSFYGAQNPMTYGESDRAPGAGQRIVPTITLTSHRIQFGCQQNPPGAPYGGQRYEDASGRHPYYVYPPHPGKPWADGCMEHPSSASAKSNNRGRTTYTDDQITELEGVFNRNPYPTSQTRQHLAYKIDVPEGKVKIWFQNRRARAKKFKLGCVGGGGGSWRMQLNESRNIEDQVNRNNNNLNNDFNKSGESSFSINTLLPLPTKPTIGSQLNSWSSASSLHQKSSEASEIPSEMHSSQHNTSSSSYRNAKSSTSNLGTSSFPNREYERNYKTWNWGSQVPMPQHFPTVERQPSMYEPPPNMGVKQYARNSGPYERSSQGSSWHYPGAMGNVPDLITQTSRVGLNDSTSNEENAPSVPDVDQSESISTIPNPVPIAESSKLSSNNDSSNQQKASQSQDAHSSCVQMPSSSSSPSCFAPVFQDRKMQVSPTSMKSPPPIRRLVFPFHTLTDAKPVRPEYSGMTRALAYPTNLSKQEQEVGGYGRVHPPTSGILGQERNEGARILDSQVYGGGVNCERDKYMRVAENFGYQGGWSLGYPAVRTNILPENSYQGNVKYITSSQAHHSISSQSDQIPDDDDIDDGDVTDDAVDDVRGMEGVKAEECDQKSSFNFQGGNYTHYLTGCWGGSTVPNPTVKASEYAEEDAPEVARGTTRNVERLTNLTSDVITPVESTTGWSNQLMSGMYPPTSASMVG